MFFLDWGELCANVQKDTQIIVPYSGGLDGTYVLAKLRQECKGCAIKAIKVGLGCARDESNELLLERLGIKCIYLDLTNLFVDKWIAMAIRAEAIYRGLYPVSATLSRPLIVQALGNKVEINKNDIIVITATLEQNTLIRMVLPVMKKYGCRVFLPFVQNNVDRNEKLRVAKELGLQGRSDSRSIDENLWVRVIENGGLENPCHPLPKEGIFLWTVDPKDSKRATEDISLEFENGIPRKLNDEVFHLRSIIEKLNKIGGAYGIGRYAHLEETGFGYHNHEVREAPAANILFNAHADLVNSIYGGWAISMYRTNKEWWTELASGGYTETTIFQAISDFIVKFNEKINGKVTVRLEPGRSMVVARETPETRCHALAESGSKEFFNSLDISKMLELIEKRI